MKLTQTQVDLLKCAELHERKFSVEVAGATHTATRAYLGDHLRLGFIYSEFVDRFRVGELEFALNSLRKYFMRALKLEDLPADLSFQDVLVFIRLVELNSIQATLSFGSESPSKPQNFAYDFPQRAAIVWYHRFAHKYGWTEDQIDRLIPERALCYLQEMMVEDADDREWEYELAGAGNTTGLDGKTPVHRPFPKPAWMQPMQLEKDVKRQTTISISMLPVGLVIGAGGEEQHYDRND